MSEECPAMAAKEAMDPLDGVDHPMFKLESPKLTKKEKVLKCEVDAYLVSDVRETARLLIGQKAFEINNAVDLPDATCDGLTFKMRLVHMKGGNCYLMARWKPDRYMRRNTGGLSQKWFLEKELFPTDASRFLEKMQQETDAIPEA
jgi:hypothetical protein